VNAKEWIAAYAVELGVDPPTAAEFSTLLDVAAEAFATHGVEASLEKIAKCADVGIGTLYRHFPTRDALVEAVYRHNVDLLCDGADELRATLPPDEALAEWGFGADEVATLKATGAVA